jgi:hypothetical protein
VTAQIEQNERKDTGVAKPNSNGNQAKTAKNGVASANRAINHRNLGQQGEDKKTISAQA